MTDEGQGEGRQTCGARKRNGTGTCGRPAGWGTDHVGVGSCKLHGGSTRNGRKHGRSLAAAKALTTLAIPVVGDPIKVLEAAIESAYGFLLGARRLLADTLDEDQADGLPFTAEEAAELYGQAIDRAARTAKFGVDAKLDEARLTIARELAERVIIVVRVGLDVFERTGNREEAERAIVAELRSAAPVGDGLN